MRIVKRIVLGLFAVVALLVAGLAIFVASRQNLKFDATPEPAIAASTDSAVIARGHYIVRNVAPCAGCHGAPDQAAAYMQGADVPLSGGFEFAIPPGSIFVRNITPDPGTGIGAISDGKLARALRYGVGHDGRALLPFMEMQGLSDEDLTAVISYLRSQPPVKNDVPWHRYTVLGKIVKATVLANPMGPKETPPAVSPRGATVENGRYLAASVATCQGCHTQRNLATGQFLVPEFAGSSEFLDESNPTMIWGPPNLTPDPKTGVLVNMSEDQFVARIRAGRILPGSPMPWQAYARMEEDDLRAIYRFLKSLPPHEHDTGPRMRPRDEKKS